MIDDPCLRFWLHAVGSEGALWEMSEDAARMLLPVELQAELRLPEFLTVTTDPDVAEEEPDALLLIPGHPALETMIARVIARGDVGHAYLSWPKAVLPGPAVLLERARATIGVEHGRIDLAAEPVCVYRPILRLGVLVTYTLEDSFQEREEIWVDAHGGVVLDAVVAERLSGPAPFAAIPAEGHHEQPADLERALQSVQHVLLQRIALRSEVLARQSQVTIRDELTRAEAYYEAALETLARRRKGAPPERQALFDKQAEATQAERSRRRHEIEAKFEVAHTLRPYRAHFLRVPALALPVTIRRGERRYPFELCWLLPLGGFLPFRCPSCGALAHLIAERERLGCAACASVHTGTVPSRTPRRRRSRLKASSGVTGQ